jgi:hypothetical protein
VINRLTSSISYANELDSAADRIQEISRADLQIMLRRAALRFRNAVQVPLEPELENALARITLVNDVSRGELIQSIVKDWLISNGHLVFEDVDEDSDTAGSA